MKKRVFVTTVVRGARTDDSGDVLAIDWPKKKIIASRPVVATNPKVVDPNPRGNTRGGRGLATDQNHVYVASYHSIYSYDHDLEEEVQLTNGLMAGIHEIFLRSPRSLLVTSTAIDAVVDIDPRDGNVNHVYWPREHPEVQRALDVKPLKIDKTADNRHSFLGREHIHGSNHLHLNAVTVCGERLYALFHRPGVVADLDSGEVIIKHPRLKQAHNLLLDDDAVWTCDTLGRAIVKYSLKTGELLEEKSLTKENKLRMMAYRYDVPYRFAKALARMNIRGQPKQRPFWVRGLARFYDQFLIGFSPATIVLVEPKDGKVHDMLRLSNDTSVCTHGLVSARSP